MDQEHASEALNPSSASITAKKLNAKAPEFVPRSSGSSSPAPPPPPPPVPFLRPLYVRPPLPFLPPPYYGYENYYKQNVPPFYGNNVRPVGPVDFVADVRNGSTASTPTAKNGLAYGHQKIINQVEFYFSDINLATTDQLFRFMCNNPDGYVPLSIVASFKKINTAISDISQLASILQSSNKLLVSEDETMVKRKHPLTESNMEELQSRIVIAENLPEDHSHQNLMKIFSSVGSVKSIRTCPPQTGKGDGSHISGKFHAFVEYESVEVAEKAVTELKDDASWRNSLKVQLMLKPAANLQIKSTHIRTQKVGHEDQTYGKKDEEAVPEVQGFNENHSEDSLRPSDAKKHEIQLDDKAKLNVPRRGRNGGGKGKGRGQGRGRPQHPTNGERVLGSPPLEVSSEKQSIAKLSPVPRMPDGTKGFSVGRGKSVAV